MKRVGLFGLSFVLITSGSAVCQGKQPSEVVKAWAKLLVPHPPAEYASLLKKRCSEAEASSGSPPVPRAPSASSFIHSGQVAAFYAVPTHSVFTSRNGSIKIAVPPSFFNRLRTLANGNASDADRLNTFETALTSNPTEPIKIQLETDLRYALLVTSSTKALSVVTGTGKSLDVIQERLCCPAETVPRGYLQLTLRQELPLLPPAEFQKPDGNQVVIDGWMVIARGKEAAGLLWMNGGATGTRYNQIQPRRIRTDRGNVEDRIDIDGDGVEDFASTTGCMDDGCRCVFANVEGSWVPIAFDHDGPGCESGC